MILNKQEEEEEEEATTYKLEILNAELQQSCTLKAGL